MKHRVYRILSASLLLGSLIYFWIVSERSISLASVLGDEGAYAISFDLHRKGGVAYRDFIPGVAPLVYVFVDGLVKDLSLVNVRHLAVVFHGATLVLLTLFLFRQKLEERWAVPLLVLLAAALGPQVAGHVPYADLFCGPFFMLWLISTSWAARESSVRGTSRQWMAAVSSGSAVILGCMKPQYGVLCLAANWLLFAPVLRSIPLMLALLMFSSGFRFPVILGVLAVIAARVATRTSPAPASCFAGHLAGIAVTGMVTVTSIAFCHPPIDLLLFPSAMLQRAANFRHAVLDQQFPIAKWLQVGVFFLLWGLALASNGQVRLFRLAYVVSCLGVSMTAIQLCYPHLSKLLSFDFSSPGEAVLSVGTVVLSLSFPLVLLGLASIVLIWNERSTLSSGQCCCVLGILVVFGACYDLSYIHSRFLPILFTMLLVLYRESRVKYLLYGWMLAVLFIALLGFNLPYFIEFRDSLASRTLIWRKYVPLPALRAGILVLPADADLVATVLESTNPLPGAVEAIDLPGLCFLMDRYSSFQKSNGQYYWLLDNYPNPSEGGTGGMILPNWNAPYRQRVSLHRPLVRTVQASGQTYLIFGEVRSE